MGCGCKNKQNETQSQPTQQSAAAAINEQKKQQSENVKEAIKKTIEKYYNVNKTNK